MTARMIPRDLVAAALNVSPDALPAGDLPVERLALRLLTFLRASLTEEAGSDHPEFWSFALFGALAGDHQDLALATTFEAAKLVTSVEEADLLAAGPLSEVLNSKGADQLLPGLQVLADQSPRFAWLLAGAQAEGSSNTPFWQAVQAIAEEAPDTSELPAN